MWSSFGQGGYSVGVARSASGELLGPWVHDSRPLHDGDGGHCMTFHDFDGNFWLTFHQPNGHPDERPKFLQLAEEKHLHPA